ncbi:MAG: tetratricopeptide repeat protein [Pseudomonadota bacterium]
MTDKSLNDLTRDAQVLRQQGRHAEAIDALGAIVALAPENLHLHHNHAAALGDAGRNREAAAILRTAIARGLNAPQSWLVYARALTGIQKFEEAKKAFRRVLAQIPNDPAAHRDLAQLVWMQTGDREKAIAALNTAIERDPSAAALHIVRAQIFGQTGAPEAEYEVMKEAARRAPGVVDYEVAACNAALACRSFEAAAVHGRRAVSLSPDGEDALASCATALIATGDAALAEPMVETLLAHQPLNQLYIAMRASIWRLRDDDRYRDLYDYDALVRAAPLDAPEGWASSERYVDDLIEALDEAHCYAAHPFFQSVKNGSQVSSITGSDNPAIRAFEEAAAGPISDYLARLGAGSDPVRSRNIGGFRVFSAWSVSLPPAGFHVDHVHPQGWLSSACHLRPAAKDPADEKAGWLKFGEPGIATRPTLEAERYVEPQAGCIVLFPSYVWHGTAGFSSGPARLTIAADIVPTAY